MAKENSLKLEELRERLRSGVVSGKRVCVARDTAHEGSAVRHAQPGQSVTLPALTYLMDCSARFKRHLC